MNPSRLRYLSKKTTCFVMPFLPLKVDRDDVYLGMWVVREDEKYFVSHLNIYENEDIHLQAIRHPRKRLEWLSSRLCLKQLLSIRHRVESLNEVTGKPYLSDHSFNISYSHSNMYSGAIASEHGAVSMDLEDLTKNRNPDLRFQFMHPDELEIYDKLKDDRFFYLIWSGKETLYKIHGQRGIVFKENFLIPYPSAQMKPEGSVKGIITTKDARKTYEIHYKFFEDILLTYTYDFGGVQCRE